MKILVTSDGSKVRIKPAGFLGGELFKTYLDATRGARYSPEHRCQETVLTKLGPILETLKARGFDVQVEPAIKASLGALFEQTRLDYRETGERVAETQARLAAQGRALYPFQVHGMQWLSSRHGALLADDMGLGKTVQTLVALPSGAPVLVVCPALAKGVWKREVAAWRPDYRVHVLSGRGSFRWPSNGEIVVTNYDILPAEMSDMACPEGCVLVGDEIHATKNSKASRTKRWRSLAANVQRARGRVWGLSGTPLLNKAPELWTVLQGLGLASDAFGSWREFCRVMAGRKAEFGYVWGTPTPEAGEMLKKVMLRRLKSEVLPQLPAKTYCEVEIEIDKKTAKVCDETIEQLKRAEKALDDGEGGLDLGEISSARAALATAKISALLELIAEHEELEEPLVVFSAHRAPIDILSSREGWAVITGDTSSEERADIQDRFQRGELRGVGATVRAGGVAITLTRASKAIFVDRDWTPALNDQAEDRICRIGQDRGCVITTLVANHILDRRVTDLLMKKRTIINATVEAARQLEAEIKLPEKEQVQSLQSAPDATLGSSPKPSGVDSNERLPRFQARTPRERWAERGVGILAENDPDGAQNLNGVGFNKLDCAIGHKMFVEVCKGQGLTAKQWSFMVRFLAKYQRQIGPMPTSDEEYEEKTKDVCPRCGLREIVDGSCKACGGLKANAGPAYDVNYRVGK